MIWSRCSSAAMGKRKLAGVAGVYRDPWITVCRDPRCRHLKSVHNAPRSLSFALNAVLCR